MDMARQARYQSDLLSIALGISQRQLQRLMKTYFGCSPCAWLNAQRLKTAGELLKKCRSIKSVCFDLNFKQPSHFTREFKRYYGLSPSVFLGNYEERNDQPDRVPPSERQLSFRFMSPIDK